MKCLILYDLTFSLGRHYFFAGKIKPFISVDIEILYENVLI